MKRNLIALTRRYRAALQKHLREPQRSPRFSREDLTAVQRLGHQALAIRLETLDMARIHEQAVVPSAGGLIKDGRTKRASAFFVEVIYAIEETHFTAREARGRLDKLNETLRQRTVELASSHRQLNQKILRRKTAEEALKRCERRYTNSLKGSIQMQERLRRLTRRLLLAQENERTRISQELQNEIAQTLLGINVRLLSLKARARVSTKRFQKEIDSTQRLVARSALTVRRVGSGIEKGI